MTTRILIGDCLEKLRGLPPESVHCAVTSPPYYGLRDYGVAEAIGLEPTPEEHIAKLVEVFREVRRVLRKDGVLWLNYGDAYAASPSGHKTGADGRIRPGVHDPNTTYDDRTFTNKPFSTVGNGYKAKDLLMMPARVALALQADGWWLRSMMPWVKRSAMPESVTDRPATAIEYVFLLAKSPRYFFDMEAVRKEFADDRLGNPGNYKPDYSIGAGRNDAGTKNAAWLKGAERGGRNFRNSDLFYASLEPPHGLICGEEPLALDVNPAAFSDWSESIKRIYVERDDPRDGKRCIPSPDCPAHEDLIALVAKELCGEHGDAQSIDSERIGDRLVQALSDGCEPIGLSPAGLISRQKSDCSDQSCSPSATDHNKESHRTDHVPETNQPCTPCAGNPDRTAGTSASPASFGQDRDNGENNISADVRGGNPSNQTPGDTAGKQPESAFCEALASPECTCKWYIEKLEKTSHFATFPPKLVEPLIKAATSEKGVCAECGAPWVREVEKSGGTLGKSWHDHSLDETAGQRAQFSGGLGGEAARTDYKAKTTGWSPSCGCHSSHYTSDLGPQFNCPPITVPATVLDPFGGTGTVGLVADRLKRNSILIELNPDYADMARRRIEGDAPLFAEVAP